MPEHTATAAFRSAYAHALAQYLATGDEDALRSAYELGREAVTRELSVVELGLVHHDVVTQVLAEHSETAGRTTDAAGAFFAESLSAFEMVRRGFLDARDAALAERRQAALVRRFSSFLADASLASGGSDSYREMLQLAAEQALELVPARYCVATASIAGRTTAFATADERPGAVPAWVAAVVENSDGGTRDSLVASLRGLDGSTLGFVALFDRRDGRFTDVDAALLGHLAELTAAALERTRLYAESPAALRTER